MAKIGALKVIEEVVEDLKRRNESPRWTGSAEQLLYDTGKHDGVESGLSWLMEELNDNAR